jgi:hypothetical protein
MRSNERPIGGGVRLTIETDPSTGKVRLFARSGHGRFGDVIVLGIARTRRTVRRWMEADDVPCAEIRAALRSRGVLAYDLWLAELPSSIHDRGTHAPYWRRPARKARTGR